MLHDYKLGIRMLLKYPGLTMAGGLALAIAIGAGAGWYDVMGKFLAPTIPLPDGDRLVLIDTRNTLANAPERRVVHDFLEWRRELRTVAELGAYRTVNRNLMGANGAPELIQVAELTAAAFGAARVTPLLGRSLLESDEQPGAAPIVLLGYDVWRRALAGRPDIVGTTVQMGDVRAVVIGVMPKAFGYPVNHDAWVPLSLRASYEPLEGGPIAVVGRLARGISREQANAELRVVAERAAAALPATHAHLRPRIVPLAGDADAQAMGQAALRNLPALLVLAIACLSVGTLVYARTATRQGEIALRSALGASRGRIVGQLFVEALVLAVISAAVGLTAASWVVTWGIETASAAVGGAPFWITPGLTLSTTLFAGGLAVAGAAMLSLLPALKATRVRVQPHLANLGSGGATLRFGRVWTGAMVVQVALTAIGIPTALESVGQTLRKLHVRAEFPSRDYLAARVDFNRPMDDETTSAFQARRARTFAALAERLSQESGVVAISFSDHVPGSLARTRNAAVDTATGAAAAYQDTMRTAAVEPAFFDVFDRPIVAGRVFHAGDSEPSARTVIVNEAFARAFFGAANRGSPIGARIRYQPPSGGSDDDDEAAVTGPPLDVAYEIVGVVRDFRLDPDDSGYEQPFVFHAASVGTASPLVMSVRTRDNAAALAARLPFIAAAVDPRLVVHEAKPLERWIRERDTSLLVMVGVQVAVTLLVLFLSALGVFSLMSVSVSRRTREIGLRTALGATTRQVVTGILSRAVVLTGSGIAAGGAIMILAVALGMGPSGRPVDDMALFAGYLAVTSAIMLAACLLACLGPARRALRIDPTAALKTT